MNHILAADTANSLMSLCLKKNDSYFELNIDDGLRHSERLMAGIIQILALADVQKSDLDLLVCSEGPGSFTGLRIGMSTLKGLSFGLDIPLTAVDSCSVLARGYDYFPGAVVTVQDARKKRFYNGVFHKGTVISPPRDLTEDEILALVSDYDQVLFTGPDCHMINTDARPGLLIDGNGLSGKGRQLLNLGRERFLKEGPLPDDCGPLYLRKSEAEIALYGEQR